MWILVSDYVTWSQTVVWLFLFSVCVFGSGSVFCRHQSWSSRLMNSFSLQCVRKPKPLPSCSSVLHKDPKHMKSHSFCSNLTTSPLQKLNRFIKRLIPIFYTALRHALFIIFTLNTPHVVSKCFNCSESLKRKRWHQWLNEFNQHTEEQKQRVDEMKIIRSLFHTFILLTAKM